MALVHVKGETARLYIARRDITVAGTINPIPSTPGANFTPCWYVLTITGSGEAVVAYVTR